MSLDVDLINEAGDELYSRNITSNLTEMAEAAGIYEALWRPEEHGLIYARQLIAPLEIGLALLKVNPEHFRQYNAPNGWGKYENLVDFVQEYLKACREHPRALVRTS